MLRVGARCAGTIPLRTIADCRRLDQPAVDWCRSQGVDARDTVTASPFDKPNLVLLLEPDQPVRLHHLGRERGGLACVFVYADVRHCCNAHSRRRARERVRPPS